MKTYQTLRQLCALFLVWMLTQIGPVQELRKYTGGWISTAHAAAVDSRLPECQNLNSEEKQEAESSGRCTVQSMELENDGWIISEGYVSTLLTWAVAMVFMYQILRCRMPSVSCGYSTIFSALGAVALFAGEIASVVGFAIHIGKIKKKVEYRLGSVMGMQGKCDSNTAPTAGSGSSGSGFIGDVSPCDQFNYLKDQKEAMEGAKTAATWKFGLAIAAAAAFAIAAIIELVGWIQGNMHDAVLFAMGNTSTAAVEGASSSCTAFTAPPAVLACQTACQACVAGIATAQEQLSELIAQSNNVITPTTSVADCTKYRVHRTTAQTTAETACMAASATAPACRAAALAYTSALAEAVAVSLCPQNQTCHLGCAVPGTLLMGKYSPDEFYNSSRKTCGLERTYELDISQARTEYGYDKLALNPFLEVVELPDIFFKRSVSGSDLLLINDEEVQRELARSQMVIELQRDQEKISLNDYYKIRQFYGDDLFDNNQFNFLKIIIDSAAAENKTKTSEDSGMPVHQVIGSGLGIVAMAIPIFIGLLKTADLQADNAFSTPARRFGWNSLATILATGQAIYTKLAVIDVLDGNITKLQKILDLVANDPRSVEVPPPASQIPYNAVVIDDDFVDTPPPQLPPGQTLPCPAGGDGKGGCKEVGNIVDASLGSVDLSSLAGLTGSLKSLNSNVSGKNSFGQGTFNNVATLGSAARGLKKKIGEMQKKINKNREKMKLPPVDFASMQTQQLKGMFKKAKDYLAAKGMTADQLMPVSPVDPTNTKELEKKVADGAVGAAKIDAKKGSAVPDLSGLVGDFKFDEGEGAGAAIESHPETSASKELDDTFQVPNNDIASDANADIFQMLSSRYLKTAYPIFFEEETAPAKAP
ncbi:MAG: hypothetical protein HYV97_09255 [Bdellovibrio sp.]|nr:hypothetical protein [Bdellovibrio sp.]